MSKCFVPSCPNKSHQGRFSLNVCMPCAELAKQIDDVGLYEAVENTGTCFMKGVIAFIGHNTDEVMYETGFEIKGRGEEL